MAAFPGWSVLKVQTACRHLTVIAPQQYLTGIPAKAGIHFNMPCEALKSGFVCFARRI